MGSQESTKPSPPPYLYIYIHTHNIYISIYLYIYISISNHDVVHLTHILILFKKENNKKEMT